MTFNGSAVIVVLRDGTLWIGGNVPSGFLDTSATVRAENEMVRWGDESDWLDVGVYWWHQAVGIKLDHSLWVWGQHLFGFRPDAVVHPVRVSDYNDWVAIAPYRNEFLAFANDGSLCLWTPLNGFGEFAHYGPDSSKLLMPSRIKAREIANLRK